MAVLWLLLVIIRFPTYRHFSIDDAPLVLANEGTPKYIADVFLGWNRYIIYLFNLVLGFVADTSEQTLSYGYFFAVAGMVVFGFSAMRLLNIHQAARSYLLVAYFSLYPVLYILLHFTLIQFSLAIVFFVCAALLWVNKGAPRLGFLFGSSAIATTIVAGSYQSGLYILFLAVALLVYHQARFATSWVGFAKAVLATGGGLGVGFAIYTALGKLVAIWVEPRGHFSSREPSEMIDVFGDRFSNFERLVNDFRFIPGRQQTLVVVLSVGSLVYLIASNRTNRYEKVALGFFGITFSLCMLQLLTIPVSFDDQPLRSFWFIPLLFSFAIAALWEKTAGDERWDKINMGVVAVVALLVLQFGYSTLKQNEGLDGLRQTDKLAAAHIEQRVLSMQDPEKPVVIGWSEVQQQRDYHRHTIGAVRSLFWADWSSYWYLRYETSLSNVRAPGYRDLKHRCQEETVVNERRMPLVMNKRNIILICF